MENMSVDFWKRWSLHVYPDMLSVNHCTAIFSVWHPIVSIYLNMIRFYKKYLQEKMSNQVHDDIQAARLRTIADSDQDQEEPEPRPEAVEVAEHSLCVVCLRAEREARQ